jgi:acetyl esterase/lipase
MKLFADFLFYIFLFSYSSVSTVCNKGVNEKREVLIQQDSMNVSYGTDVAQKMDVYLPASRTSENTKVLVLIHGGSWSGGDKSEFNAAIPVLRQQLKDFAFFNINYRLANGNRSSSKFPAQIEDVQSAIDFITTKADEYNINPDKIALLGVSAGAHLALLQAYKNNSDGRIKAIVDLFGPTDLVTLYNNHPFGPASQSALFNFLKSSPTSNPGLYRDASPINFVNAQSVPTQIFHGAGDIVVPIVQSTALKTKLEAANAKVEMIVYPNEGHGWFGANLFDTYAKAVSFIQQNVK